MQNPYGHTKSLNTSSLAQKKNHQILFGKKPVLPSPRLALLAVLKLEPESLGILAPVCSSMGWLAASQSKRNFMLPLGDPSKSFVQDGNMLAIRSLVMYMIKNFPYSFYSFVDL